MNIRGVSVNNSTYSSILLNTLQKKYEILDRLIVLTKQQEGLILSSENLLDDMEAVLDEKEKLIDSINQLDQGFEQVFEHVKEEFSAKKDSYKEVILKLQDLIKNVTKKSAELQTLEIKNQKGMQDYFSRSKKEIQQFKQSSQMVSSYYKNMSNQHQGQSYFLDKKK